MSPATRPPDRRDGVRLLAVDAERDTIADRAFADLPVLLEPGDVVVVNDAATLPASLAAITERYEPVELRLLGPASGDRWQALLFGDGSWRERTEDRAPPPSLPVGARLSLAGGAVATVEAVSPRSPRLVELALDAAAVYRHGAPVQYAYLEDELALWSVQTVYGGRPWAAEMPSAGRPLTWQLIERLRDRGIAVVPLTHAAGLSSTGDPELDALLPLPERYDIPAATAARVAGADRVIAIGTTVVRALESAALTGALTGETSLVIDGDHRLRTVDAIVSGMHAAGESHYRLLAAFAPPHLLDRALARATELGYRNHEFGDATLITASSRASRGRRARRGDSRRTPPPAPTRPSA